MYLITNAGLTCRPTAETARWPRYINTVAVFGDRLPLRMRLATPLRDDRDRPRFRIRYSLQIQGKVGSDRVEWNKSF